MLPCCVVWKGALVELSYLYSVVVVGRVLVVD